MDAFFLRIFDTITNFGPLDRHLFSHMDVTKLRKVYQKIFNREIVVYVVFGVLATLVNLAAHFIAVRLFASVNWQGSLHLLFPTEDYSYLDATMIAWVIAVLFAFITNKLWVFSSRSWSPHLVRRELTAFLAARLLSLGVELLCMFLFVSIFSFHRGLSKLIVQVIIVILNYMFSKLFIFKNTGRVSGDALKADTAEKR